MPGSISINPLTDNCSFAYRKKEHVCIGISPFNSLFSEDYISKLIKWALNNFQSFNLFLPDEPTVYTLKAIGYNDQECTKKLKKQINWLRNKIKRALLLNGIQENNHNEILLDAKSLKNNEHFKKEHQAVLHNFESDSNFRQQCIKATSWVLQNKTNEDPTVEQLETAVKYFLFELPLFAKTDKIVKSKSSIFCYHQAISFHNKLYNKDFNYIPSPNQGYGVIQV